MLIEGSSVAEIVEQCEASAPTVYMIKARLKKGRPPLTGMQATQQQRIFAVLHSLQTGKHDIPEHYLRRHKTGDGISARYFKQVLLVSECNGRISELRSKGYDIETSQVKDDWGGRFEGDVPPLRCGITSRSSIRSMKKRAPPMWGDPNRRRKADYDKVIAGLCCTSGHCRTNRRHRAARSTEQRLESFPWSSSSISNDNVASGVKVPA